MNYPEIVPYRDWVDNIISHTLLLDFGDSNEIVHFDNSALECKSCWGKGSVKCDFCNGQGIFECKSCDGTGIDEDGDECEQCQARSDEVCIVCKGNKEFQCEECCGTGKIIPEQYEYLSIELHDYEAQKQIDLMKWEQYHKN